jgi:hypothetical protein
MAYSFASNTRQQRNFYGDHIAIADYIEEVKGYITSTNRSANHTMHPAGFDLDSEIHSLGDITFTDSRLSLDQAVPSQGLGRQEVHVNVFDLYYYKGQLQPSLLSDPAQMSLLPPPINTSGHTTVGSGSNMDAEGDSVVNDRASGTGGRGASFYPWERYGAYLIRVQLFDVEGAYKTLRRTAEEAFFQFLSPDATP